MKNLYFVIYLTATKGEMTIRQEKTVSDREKHPGKFAL